MRVALFFDGKNFYSGLKDRAPNYIVDFTKMSNWLVKRVNGTHLWSAYYYTGVETGTGSRTESQTKLSGFLDMLELQPGFFVKRFPRKTHSFNCSHCGTSNRFTFDKEIDTTMAADMMRLAAIGSYDIMVLLSGDADHTPAIEGIRALGKQAYVATWGRAGLSTRIRKAAFDHIDLLEGLEEFAQASGETAFNDDEYEYDFEGENEEIYETSPDDEVNGEGYSDEYSEESTDNGESDVDWDNDPKKLFMEELDRAQNTFQTGYVGMNYFLKRWQSDTLVEDAEKRRQIMDELIDAERVEVYEASDGNKAIRLLD